MASRNFKANWSAVYRDYYNDYYTSDSTARVGGGSGYNTYLGFDYQAINRAINDSTTSAKVIFHMYVKDTGEFDLGMHKETYNRKASGLPFYRYSGRVFNPNSKGWASYDITSLPTWNTFEGALNDGYTGVVLYGANGSSYGEAWSVSNNSYHMYIEVQGTWNTKPSKPGISYPSGGETLDELVDLQGTPSTDSEQSQSALRYQWGIFDGSWHYLNLTNAGNITSTVNFSAYNETSSAKVSLRAFDGELYSDWVYSDVFTINHNKPPGVPTNLDPIGGRQLERTNDTIFSWNHNDDDTQSAYTFRWRTRGSSSWNETRRVSTNQFHIISANTFPVGNIEWQVRTEDQRGLISPFSSTQLVYATESSDAPTILNPSQGESVEIAQPVIEWSSVNQDYFDLEIYTGSDATGDLIWNTSMASEVKGITVGTNLANNTDYYVRVRVKAENEFYSAWDGVAFHTSFTPPEQAEVDLLLEDESASIQIAITNPESTDSTVPDVVRNELFRRKANSSDDFIKIARDIAADSYFIDYTPASDILYEYKVRSWGDNETFMDSVPVIGSIKFNNSILLLVSDPSEQVSLIYNPSRSENRSYQRGLMQFNGREYPVAEFERTKERSVDLSFDLRDRDSLYQLEDLLDRTETLLYRDGRGRRMFCTVGSFKISDKMPDGYSVSFAPDQVDFKEGLE